MCDIYGKTDKTLRINNIFSYKKMASIINEINE